MILEFDNKILDFSHSPYVEDVWFRKDLDDYFSDGSSTEAVATQKIEFKYKVNRFKSFVFEFFSKTNPFIGKFDVEFNHKKNEFKKRIVPFCYEHDGVKLPTLRVIVKNFED